MRQMLCYFLLHTRCPAVFFRMPIPHPAGFSHKMYAPPLSSDSRPQTDTLNDITLPKNIG